ncbi:primosomal protein [Arsenicicoccus sp. UBA7492]|uniref:primosomal protein n=1 Tax=Arsenicicoccus sp. UBA7492 TaxID=1946057 RepID=UPI002580BE31|nr:primosomal protein [Arsenicicoccus sp. UBA7492]
MSTEPRAALATFISAIERHFEAAASRRDDDDPAVVNAYQELADAFEAYDEALDDAFGEVTPLGIYTDDDDDDDEDGPYVGLDDEGYDDEDDDDDDEDDEEEDGDDRRPRR